MGKEKEKGGENTGLRVGEDRLGESGLWQGKEKKRTGSCLFRIIFDLTFERKKMADRYVELDI